MMDIHLMKHIYRSRFSVVINENTYASVYKFDQPFFSFQEKSFKFLKMGYGIYL